jgi:hypothetical protein
VAKRGGKALDEIAPWRRAGSYYCRGKDTASILLPSGSMIEAPKQVIMAARCGPGAPSLTPCISSAAAWKARTAVPLAARSGLAQVKPQASIHSTDDGRPVSRGGSWHRQRVSQPSDHPFVAAVRSVANMSAVMLSYQAMLSA